MMASRLNHRERVIPALTDHLEDKGGVIGPPILAKSATFSRLKLRKQTTVHIPLKNSGLVLCAIRHSTASELRADLSAAPPFYTCTTPEIAL
jgi:hypothetical protein